MITIATIQISELKLSQNAFKYESCAKKSHTRILVLSINLFEFIKWLFI